jgi:hypothetical protein
MWKLSRYGNEVLPLCFSAGGKLPLPSPNLISKSPRILNFLQLFEYIWLLLLSVVYQLGAQVALTIHKQDLYWTPTYVCLFFKLCFKAIDRFLLLESLCFVHLFTLISESLSLQRMATLRTILQRQLMALIPTRMSRPVLTKSPTGQLASTASIFSVAILIHSPATSMSTSTDAVRGPLSRLVNTNPELTSKSF